MQKALKKGQYGTFYMAGGISHTGYIGYIYEPVSFSCIENIVKNASPYLPREGYVLVTTCGELLAINDNSVLDYKQIRIKPEIRKKYEIISDSIDRLIRNQYGYVSDIHAYRKRITKIETMIEEKYTASRDALQADMQNIISLAQAVEEVKANMITLHDLIRVLKDNKLISPIDTKPDIIAVNGSIIIKGKTKMHGSVPKIAESWLEEARRKYSINPANYPRQISDYTVTLEDNITMGDNVVYTLNVCIKCPDPLSQKDLTEIVTVAQSLGLLPVLGICI